MRRLTCGADLDRSPSGGASTMKKWIFLGIGVAIGVCVRSAAGGPATQDPVAVSPQYYTVRFENDRVRVLEYRLPPGQKEPMHSHPPGIVYAISDATMRSTPSGGQPEVFERKAGEVAWRDSTTHSAENVGAADIRALAIELKPCGHS
jgi:quercetin dioxygenase-like cupin family protein